MLPTGTLAGWLCGAGRLAGARAGKKAMTAQEKIARDTLLAVIAPSQMAAQREDIHDLVRGDSA